MAQCVVVGRLIKTDTDVITGGGDITESVMVAGGFQFYTNHTIGGSDIAECVVVGGVIKNNTSFYIIGDGDIA